MDELKAKTGQGLKEMLEEMYAWYFKAARKYVRGKKHTADTAWRLGKMDGGVEAIGAVYLAMYGGKEMWDLWQGCLQDCEDEEKAGTKE